MYRRVLLLLLTAVLLLSGCTAGQKNMPQKTDEKEMTGQPSDMPGKPVSCRYALKSLLFEIFHKRLRREPQHGSLPIDQLTTYGWYAIFSYSAPAMLKNSAGDSTVTPKSLALDSLLPAFSPQTR